MDVTNPGLVSVASETYGNPDPNGGTSQIIRLPSITVVPTANFGHPPANNGVSASVFPTPANVGVDQLPVLPPPGSSAIPPVPNVNVDDQVLGQGTWQDAVPGDPSAGKNFVEPADFIVVGPAESFQTNATELDEVVLTVAAVYDADNLFQAPTPGTTRYYLVVGTPPDLTSYPVSLLGRQVIFSVDTTTSADAGAARLITNYGPSFVVVNRDDPTPSNGDVPILTTPQAGDTLSLDVSRLGSEQVNTTAPPTTNVAIDAPPVYYPSPAQSIAGGGTTDVSTGPQPAPAPVTSGVNVPRTSFSNVVDQPAPNLPTNVFV